MKPAVGANWQQVVNGFHGPTHVIAAIVVLALAVAAWRYARRRSARSPATDDREWLHSDQSSTGRHR